MSENKLLLAVIRCPQFTLLSRYHTENEVILFTLPPNTTHLSQPLNKGVFGPFKAHWKLVCHDYLVSENKETQKTKLNHYRVMSKGYLWGQNQSV